MLSSLTFSVPIIIFPKLSTVLGFLNHALKEKEKKRTSTRNDRTTTLSDIGSRW